MRVFRLRSATLIVWFIISLGACQPSVTPTPLPSATPPADFSISATNMGGAGLPAGSSTSFALTLNYPPAKPPQSVTWETQNVSNGLMATIVGGAAPWQRRLVITSDSALAAGSYALDVKATTDSAQTAQATVKVDVTACTETASGSSTTAISSNLVELITAGKPAVEHGLLIPVQICGSPKHLSVKLTNVTAEDGSTMTMLPAFYVYRSEVWPAPDHITAHPLAELFNVQVPTIAQANSAGQLDTDVGAGLYLLIFERDRYGATLTPPTTPASVTYTLTIG
jgi:hypothetical protein